MQTYYLGTHEVPWLAMSDVPLFISHKRLVRRKRLPRAVGRWALDSGAFSEISLHGSWQTPPQIYVQAVRRYQTEIGQLDWATIQDWMCEPFILRKTGLTVTEHQARTVRSYLELRDMAPEIPWIPVLQGYQPREYLDHVAQYARAGVSLDRERVVGLGSVCRRQATGAIGRVVRELSPIRLHGFGVKVRGLLDYGRELASADSMAWSFDAMWGTPLPGCQHRNCANCWRYARRWYGQIMQRIEAAEQQAWAQMAWGWAG